VSSYREPVASFARFRLSRSLAGIVFLLAQSVSAEPSVADRAVAESLFQDGRQLLDRGEVATACMKFAESHRLAPALGSLLNLAACHERLGKTASAWVEFSEAATLSERAKEHERAAYAAERANALSRELATVTITVKAADADRVVTLDGREIRAGTFGTPIPIDPGEHVVSASSPGRPPFEKRFSVARGRSATTIEIPVLSPAETAPPEPPLARATVPATSKTQPSKASRVMPAEDQEASLAPWLVAGGVGAAGIAVGTVYGLKTFREKRTVDRECPGDGLDCSSLLGLSANERAHDAALISTIGFGVGAAATAVLGYLFFSGSGDRPAPSATVSAQIGPYGAHVLGRTAF
jgi:hypothetical protein